METPEQHFDAARQYQAYYDDALPTSVHARRSLSSGKLATITDAKLCANSSARSCPRFMIST
jgi:hypothetical protein